jgi:hypothetical protein
MEENSQGREFINLIDTLAYVYAGDTDLDIGTLFMRIFQTIRVCINTSSLDKRFANLVYSYSSCNLS